MPWYWRNWRWRRRRRWPYRRRIRKIVRRRWRRNRVRRNFNFKRKLKRITVKEYQPQTIRKCKITGLTCLCYVNYKRLSWNSIMYETSIVPKHMPGGGGFAVMKMSLETLYDLHTRCYNWWTQSNDNLPLVRYTGTKITFYRSQTTDYVVRYFNQYPMTSGKLTYPSCQPSMLMMMKHSIIVSSMQNTKSRRPYKKIKIKPPGQFKTKWYFARDLNNIPLFLLHVAPCSLPHYYISPWSESNNITLRHLNTKLITNRNFATQTTNGWFYKEYGTTNLWLYATHINEPELWNLIPLTNTKYFTQGNELQTKPTNQQAYKDHITNSENWGNPFHPDNQNLHIYTTTLSPAKLAEKQFNTKVINQTNPTITPLNEHLYLETRYNPLKDTGIHNKIFLLKNNEAKVGWDPPDNENIVLEGLPLWLAIFGYIDFQKKVPTLQSIDTTTMLCIRTDTTRPIYNETIVLIDHSFEMGHSPYAGENLLADDVPKWYPQVQYQNVSINDLTRCGPGIAKTDNKLSEEIKCKYEMYFKFGGNPAKMLTIDNPAQQPIFPIPRNMQQTTSLQDPATPPEYYLYSFDQRHDQITAKAAKRIKTDWELKEPLYSITGSSKDVPVHPQKAEDETSSSESEEENLLNQLQQQRQLQHQLKHRIRQLILKTQNLE
nr:MAG: ORF1 [TTV-like mini virus]